MRGALLIVLAACARTPAPRAPSADVRAEIARAEDAERSRRHDVARAHYERAIASARDPDSANFAHRAYGETLATWGELPEARAQLEAAVAAAPRDAIAWQMLGIVRFNAGDTPGAFAALERSKALAPRAWIPRRDLAVLHWKLGNRAAALAEYRAMLDLDLPDRLREKVEWAIGELSRPPAPRPPS